MSKITFSFLVFTSTTFMLLGQCPSGDIVFTTQAQVNQFSTLYPNCRRVKASITINDSNIMFLDSLYKIDTIDFALAVNQNSALKSLEGLHNLKLVQDLGISGNPLIMDLKGLRSLKNAINSLSVENMSGLINLTGLESLENTRQLAIVNCNKLSNLIGLSALTKTSTFIIQGNMVLQNLIGVNTSKTFGDHFNISYNPNLLEFPNFTNMTRIFNFNLTGNPRLKSLKGLESLNTTWFFTISANDSLANIDAMSNLKTINFFAKIEDNKSLTQINGLANVDIAALDSLIIVNNPKLSTCNNKLTCGYVAIPTNIVRINNNAPLCATRAAISTQCSLVGNKNFALLDKINIYPNPCGNIIHIDGLPPNSYISILDQNLREVTSSISTLSNGEVNTTYLSNGLYFVVCKNEKMGIQKTFKLAIHH